MSETLSPSQDRKYGVSLVCRAWKIPRSTVHDAKVRRERSAQKSRPGPKPVVSDEELAEHIKEILADLERRWSLRGEGYRKVHARLRHAGVPANKDRVLRVMREHGLLSPTRVGRSRGPQVHDGTIVTELPDQMWGTDATTVLTLDEGNAWVFFTIDHCTGECLGIHASARGTRREAIEPLHQAVKAAFGGYAQGVARGLLLRHDHGSQFVSREFQQELVFLGIESSPSFVRSPEGNGVAERFVRTLKEQLLWLHHYRTVEELRAALLTFRDRYNQAWLVARHGYRTPEQVRASLVA